jgi:hypothetical protein
MIRQEKIGFERKMRRLDLLRDDWNCVDLKAIGLEANGGKRNRFDLNASRPEWCGKDGT